VIERGDCAVDEVGGSDVGGRGEVGGEIEDPVEPLSDGADALDVLV
jgi:hypothetical protein